MADAKTSPGFLNSLAGFIRYKDKPIFSAIREAAAGGSVFQPSPEERAVNVATGPQAVTVGAAEQQPAGALYQGAPPIAPQRGGVQQLRTKGEGITGMRNIASGETTYSMPGGRITMRGGQQAPQQTQQVVPSSAVGTTTDPRTGLSIGGVSRAAGEDFLSRQYAPPQRTVAGVGVPGPTPAQGGAVSAPEFGGSFGELMVQGLRSRFDKTYADIADQARRTDLVGRGQDITMRGQDITAASAAQEAALQAERYSALAPGAAAQAELAQAQAQRAQMGTNILQQLQTETDPAMRKQLEGQYALLTGARQRAPKVHFGTEGIERTPYAIAQDPTTGGFRYMGAAQLKGGGDMRAQNEAAYGALPAADQKAVDSYITQFQKDNKRTITGDELNAYLASLKK